MLSLSWTCNTCNTCRCAHGHATHVVILSPVSGSHAWESNHLHSSSLANEQEHRKRPVSPTVAAAAAESLHPRDTHAGKAAAGDRSEKSMWLSQLPAQLKKLIRQTQSLPHSCSRLHHGTVFAYQTLHITLCVLWAHSGPIWLHRRPICSMHTCQVSPCLQWMRHRSRQCYPKARVHCIRRREAATRNSRIRSAALEMLSLS
jgi:hypothetical protein